MDTIIPTVSPFLDLDSLFLIEIAVVRKILKRVATECKYPRRSIYDTSMGEQSWSNPLPKVDLLRRKGVKFSEPLLF